MIQLLIMMKNHTVLLILQVFWAIVVRLPYLCSNIFEIQHFLSLSNYLLHLYAGLFHVWWSPNPFVLLLSADFISAHWISLCELAAFLSQFVVYSIFANTAIYFVNSCSPSIAPYSTSLIINYEHESDLVIPVCCFQFVKKLQTAKIF